MSRAEIFVSIVAFAAFAVVIDSTLNHSAPAPRQDILHVPAGGCPAGYNLVAEVFTYQGAKLPACVSKTMVPGRATVDVLRPGESVQVTGFAFPVDVPWRSTPKS